MFSGEVRAQNVKALGDKMGLVIDPTALGMLW